jgi:hypothetical protein
MLEKGVQSFIKTVGDEGCYALALCKIAEIYNRLSSGYDAGHAVSAIRKAVEFGLLKPDMTVLDGAKFLEATTESKWTKEYKDAGYVPQKGDYLIAEWFNRRTGLTHFTLEYPVKWDGLKDSVTVKEGKIRSFRLYRTANK